MVKGVRFSGIASGIKAAGLDLGLVSFDEAVPHAALYTRNKVKAAHILYNERRAAQRVAALLVNSGCANACTGEDGIGDLATIAKELAGRLTIREEEILFASTGVIGRRLPVETVVAGLPALVAGLKQERLDLLARAIMTTDTYPKIVEEHVPGDEGCSIAGVAKGAGMINPLFATMLAFVFTDYPLDPIRMRRLLPTLGRETFERISVDGDTSTNDTVMLFSTGRGPAQAGTGALKNALARVMKALALLIVKDGEGATKVIHLTVKGAQQKRVAEALARRIAVSPLVKTAFFGCDPNWGRVIAAAGDASVPLDPEKVEIAIQGEVLAREGIEVPFSEEKLKGLMAGREIELVVDLHDGRASYDMYTTDLTYDYIKINASYRS
ncbi:MAG: bifunctional glutamate N-acetyltransferase/amino-acid acetyltransferase ArgJ [Syntrophorhabdales bacterium]|jgi:glutamate N-acetyltransferase/amino-acid N-acetyltransferase